MVKRNFAQKRNLFCNFDFEIEIPRFSEEVKNPDLFRKSKLATSSLVFGPKACQRPEWNHKSYFLVFLTWFIEFQLRFWIINGWFLKYNKSPNHQIIKTNKVQIRLFSIRKCTKFWWFDSRFLHDVTNFDACIKSKRNLEILEFLENPSQKWGDIKIPFFHRYDDVAYFIHFLFHNKNFWKGFSFMVRTSMLPSI